MFAFPHRSPVRCARRRTPSTDDARSTHRRFAALAAGVAGLLAIGACSSGTGTAVKAEAVTRSASTTTVAPTSASGSSGAPSTTPTSTAPASTSVPVPVGGPTVAVHRIQPHRAEYRGGKLYLVGDVPSRKVADELKAKAAQVIGPANVIDQYTIDPAASVPTDGRVIIDEPLLFPTGSAILDPKYDELIVLGYTVMKLNPKVVMRVTGYTDNVGGADANAALSLARAQQVVDVISAYGISPKRFEADGKGAANPVASNDTPEGRQLNRRIDVELIGLLS